MSIKDRFKMIMEREKLTAAAFAESIDVAQATISHILGSRNKYPSTEVILKLHKKYSDINLEWLLTGEGYMLNTNEKGPVNLETYITVSREAWEVIKKQADGLNAQAASLERRDKQSDELISIIKKTYILDKDNTTCPITSDFKLVK